MKTKRKYVIGEKVNVLYGNFGLAKILNNGIKNKFNHSEIIYKVQSISNGTIDNFNELHLKKT